MIENKSIEELKTRIDIVELISSYIEVKRQGSSYVCLCPFHSDNKPSMHVNPQKGFYHCFACKAGGDAFKFVMEYEKLSFSEAVEKVAVIFNFTLSYTSKNDAYHKDDKKVLVLLNSFYKTCLKSNKTALDYLFSRGLEANDLELFELGFAPSSNESLRFLENEGIELKSALSVGAIKSNEKGFYASFINRITFPIYDLKGLLVGFGGRSLDKDNPAKYVNSPASYLFDKSRLFYGFNLAKEAALKNQSLIICEGYMDTIAFHKMGFKNTVAVLGTALTPNHLPLLKRLDLRANLCFDSDEAGVNAAFKSAKLLSENSLEGSVITLKGGKDAAQLLQDGLKGEVINAIKARVGLCEFYVKKLILKQDPKTPLQKQKTLDLIKAFASKLQPLVARALEPYVAKRLDILEDDCTLCVNNNFKKPLVLSPVLGNKDLSTQLLRYIYDKQDLGYFDCFLNSKAFYHQDMLKAVFKLKDVNDDKIRLLLSLDIDEFIDDESFIKASLLLDINHLKALSRQGRLSTKDSYILKVLTLLNLSFKKFCQLFETSTKLLLGFKSLIKDLRKINSKDEAKMYFENVQKRL